MIIRKNLRLLALMLFLLSITSILSFSATKDISIYVDEKEIYFDAKPYIKNARTLVPVRFVAEELGATVNWDGENRIVTIEKGNDSIELLIDCVIIAVNGEYKTMDVAPEITNSRTFVPVRFVSEYLGAKVDWDGNNRAVIITTGDNNNINTEVPSSLNTTTDSVEEFLKATEYVANNLDENVGTRLEIDNDVRLVVGTQTYFAKKEGYTLDISILDYRNSTYDAVWEVLKQVFPNSAETVWYDLADVYNNINIAEKTGTVDGLDYKIIDYGSNYGIYVREAR